ncbi:intraflagellar transport-associated protein [Myiozetetes cayanensis]|uniref:intraflagellar transport-associated protein n=1 Tax=Myiozetetes cayanensis TaxID=478635 RepID=UPI0021609186|nr:intraflagellar transport-associated protein [Myiozetetes cayanensis]
MGEQLLENSILDQFINSHEQSHEEFLNTFTYLLKEKEGKTIQGNKVDSLRKIFSSSELSNRNKQNGSPERSKEMWVSLPSQMPNKKEQVDTYLDWKDTDSDEEMCSAGSLVLPGEVEQTVTYCTPVFDKPIQLKFITLSVPQPLDSKPQELLGDDVQPFSLDEEFDYDNVAVTPKFSEAELKAIKVLSKEKKTGSA